MRVGSSPTTRTRGPLRKEAVLFLFPCKGPQAGGGDSYLQNGLRALTPGLSPVKKRKTAIHKVSFQRRMVVYFATADIFAVSVAL